MPFLSSLFALLLIGALITWASTFHFIESVWERQAIKFTEQSLTKLIHTKHELLVIEAYAKSSTPPQDAHKEDQVEESDVTKEELLFQKRRGKISEIRKNKKTQKNATPFLHIYPLFDPNVHLENPTIKSTIFILNRLSEVLFYSQDFYILMNSPKGYHGINLDTFYKSLIDTGRKLAQTESNQNKKSAEGMIKPKELANIQMPTPHEQYLLYKVLRGGGAAVVGTVGTYQSLLEFVSFERRHTIMNLFLAPRALLLALFGDMDIVDRVCQYRQDLYLKYDKKRESKAEFEQLFQSEFERCIPSDIPAALIDFQISLTDPSQDRDRLDKTLLELP